MEDVDRIYGDKMEQQSIKQFTENDSGNKKHRQKAQVWQIEAWGY